MALQQSHVVSDREVRAIGGGTALVAALCAFAFGFWCLSALMGESSPGGDPMFSTGVRVAVGVGAMLVGFVVASGIITVNPNEAVVLQFFGDYYGTVKGQTGLLFVNPLVSKRRITLAVQSLETKALKINDLASNPVEVAAVVVFRVVDCAQSMFGVTDYEDYVGTQSESALRAVVAQHPYDAHEATDISLAQHPDQVAAALSEELSARCRLAGVEIVESRLSHLAYAPEIASVMLQRQQASAIIAARSKIVEGAVGMVGLALEKLQELDIALEPRERASLVSNLLVVLCGERSVQPTLRTDAH